jgi:hypothetical protein
LIYDQFVHGVHWGYFSGLALALLTMGMYYIYYGRETVGLPVLEGSYISAKEMELVNAVLRYNQSSGEVEAYSLQSSRFIGAKKQYEEGQRIAEAARQELCLMIGCLPSFTITVMST